MDDTAKHGKSFEVANGPQKAGAVETGKTPVTDYTPVNLDEEASGNHHWRSPCSRDHNANVNARATHALLVTSLVLVSATNPNMACSAISFSTSVWMS